MNNYLFFLVLYAGWFMTFSIYPLESEYWYIVVFPILYLVSLVLASIIKDMVLFEKQKRKVKEIEEVLYDVHVILCSCFESKSCTEAAKLIGDYFIFQRNAIIANKYDKGLELIDYLYKSLDKNLYENSPTGDPVRRAYAKIRTLESFPRNKGLGPLEPIDTEGRSV